VIEETNCPNCKAPLSPKARYCMACGHQMRYLLISNKALRMGPFPLYMIVFAVLVVPFGAVGACSLGFTVRGPDALNFPFFIICGSLGIGALMALVNFVKGTRGKP
jgi:hypothetical protein